MAATKIKTMKKLTKKSAAKLIESQLIRPGYFRYFWNNTEAGSVFNSLGTYEESRDAYEIAHNTFQNCAGNATKADRIEAICKAVNAA